MADMSEADREAVARVLDFWFAQGNDEIWFKRDEAFDRAVREALAVDHERAAAGDYDAWTGTARGCLALILLLDQVPRNLFRDDARAYASDARARAIARHAIAEGFDQEIVSQTQRRFLYLPLEHSETLADQEEGCRLMATLDEDPVWLAWAVKHRDVIARFGRFPHRNAALGRESNAAEKDFLAQPGSSFSAP